MASKTEQEGTLVVNGQLPVKGQGHSVFYSIYGLIFSEPGQICAGSFYHSPSVCVCAGLCAQRKTFKPEVMQLPYCTCVCDKTFHMVP